MARRHLKRTNILLEIRKVNQLRRQVRARSNSEAVRLAIDRQLAIEGIQHALGALRARGTLADVFGRMSNKHK